MASERQEIRKQYRDVKRRIREARNDVMTAQAMSGVLMQKGMSEKAVYNMLQSKVDYHNSLIDQRDALKKQMSARSRLSGGRGASNAAQV